MKSFLTNYFEKEEYEISQLELGNTQCFLAQRLVNFEKNICNKAILFYMSSENSFIPIMYVLNDLISQSNGSELFKARLPESQIFFGYKVFIKESNLYIITYGNQGMSVTDPVIFLWNTENKLFEEKVESWRELM